MCRASMEGLSTSMSRPDVRVVRAKVYFLAAEVSVKYELQVAFQGRTWSVERGFSEIRDFRKRIDGPFTLPPYMLLHKRTNKSWKMISSRRKGLDSFFRNLTGGEWYFSHPDAFDEFLEVDKNLVSLSVRPPPPAWLTTSWWCPLDDATANLKETLSAVSAPSFKSTPHTPLLSPRGGPVPRREALHPEITKQIKCIASAQGRATPSSVSSSAASESEGSCDTAVVDAAFPNIPEDVMLCLALGRVRQEQDGVVIYFSTPRGTPRVDQRGRLYDVAVVYSWICSFGDGLPSPQCVAAFINMIWSGGHKTALRSCRWSFSTASSLASSSTAHRTPAPIDIVVTPPQQPAAVAVEC
eukprot:TRINITY_DN67652_c0_g1_i1.p1 TRINITY_DN67652_c0_g1~~TRINITY_DN67652_c0_g1_i1.p1  ORF type:complete len:354 (+),score=116.04 TRINITY_DN67652_c0_g1_i1:383-1444(+)